MEGDGEGGLMREFGVSLGLRDGGERERRRRGGGREVGGPGMVEWLSWPSGPDLKIRWVVASFQR